MLRARLEAIVSALLQRSLHDVHFEEVPDFLAEEDLLLDFHWIAQVGVLFDLASGLQSRLVEHLVVSHEGLHHGLKQAAVEHQCWRMHEPHFNHHYKPSTHNKNSDYLSPFNSNGGSRGRTESHSDVTRHWLK
jgi:hypothetical protein